MKIWGGSLKLEKEKGWVDACAGSGWQDTEQDTDSGCWTPIGNVHSQEMPFHTPGCSTLVIDPDPHIPLHEAKLEQQSFVHNVVGTKTPCLTLSTLLAWEVWMVYTIVMPVFNVNNMSFKVVGPPPGALTICGGWKKHATVLFRNC